MHTLSDDWTAPAIERTFVVPLANPPRIGVAAWHRRGEHWSALVPHDARIVRDSALVKGQRDFLLGGQLGSISADT